MRKWTGITITICGSLAFLNRMLVANYTKYNTRNYIGANTLIEMGFAAYFKDCEGNVLGLWQNVRKE